MDQIKIENEELKDKLNKLKKTGFIYKFKLGDKEYVGITENITKR